MRESDETVSVLLKNMDMPKSCMNCRFRLKRIEEFYCYLTDTLFFMDEEAGTRLPWCPLEEVEDDND